jgi:hypothetical protein
LTNCKRVNHGIFQKSSESQLVADQMGAWPGNLILTNQPLSAHICAIKCQV